MRRRRQAEVVPREASAEEIALGLRPKFFDESFLDVLRNSSWSIGTTSVTALALVVETLLLARYLGRERFGVYVLLIAYPQAVQMILDFRTRDAMPRYLGEFLARGEKPQGVAIVKLLWFLDVAVVLTAFLIVVVTAPFVAGPLTHYDAGAYLMVVFGVAMVLGALDTTAGTILRVFNRFALSFVSGSSSAVIRLLIVIVLMVGGTGLNGLIWGRVAAEFTTTVIIGSMAFMLLKRALWEHRRASIRTLSGRFKEIGHFLFNTNIMGLIRVGSSKLDVLTVGVLAGPSAASLYKIAVQFGSSPLLVSDPLFATVYPTFARWRALGLERLIRTTGRKASLAIAATALPVAAVLAYESKPFLSLVVGRSFADAWIPTVIILAGSLSYLILFWAGAALLALGEASAVTKMAVASAAIQFALLFGLVPLFGSIGAAVSLAAMNTTGLLIGLRYLRARALI